MKGSLNDEEIKAILSNLVNRECGFEAFAVTPNLPRLKKLSLKENDEDGGIKKTLKKMVLDVVREQYLAKDVMYSPIENVADNQHKFYVVQQTKEYEPFGFLADGQGDFKLEHVKEITDFVFLLRYDKQIVTCYQKGRSVMVPNRKNAGILTRVLCRDDSVILDQQKEPLITITKAIDAIIIDGFIITDNIKMMERNFGFQQFVVQRAREAATNIAKSGFFSNTHKLDDYLSRGDGRKKTYYNKMMRALDSPVLQMTREELFQRVFAVERWKGKFRRPIDGKIPIETFRDVENLIDLLDERYTKSEITGMEYDTDVKKKAEDYGI